jgi:phage regulator Rha-like protein
MLPILQNQSLTMSSREVADLVEKDHPHVRRDIRAMILQLNYPDRILKDCPPFDLPELEGHPITVSYFEHSGNQYEEFNLNQEYCLLLVSGYSVPLRQKLI